MAAFIPAIIGAASGALGADEKNKAYQRQVDLAAATNRYSPWTGQVGALPKEARPTVGNEMLQGGMSGMGFSAQNGGGAGLSKLFGGGGGGAAPAPQAQSSWGGVAPSNMMAGGYEDQMRKPTLYGSSGWMQS